MPRTTKATSKKNTDKKGSSSASTPSKKAFESKKSLKETTAEQTHVKKNLKPYFYTTVVGIFLLSILIGQIFSIANVSRQIGDLHRSLGGVIDEVGAKLTITDQLDLIGNDMNELRSYLYLPTKDYSFGSTATDEDPDALSKETQYNKGMYMMLESIHTEQQSAERAAQAKENLSDIKEQTSYSEKLQASTMTFGEVTQEDDLIFLPVVLSDGTVFTRLTYHLDIDQWELYDYKTVDFYDNFDDFNAIVEKYFNTLDARVSDYTDFLSLTNDLSSLWSAQDIAAKLQEKGLHVGNNTILNPEEETIAQIIIDPHTQNITWLAGDNDKVYTTLEGFKEDVTNLIETLDSRTLIERSVSEKEALLKSIINDPAFEQVLKDYNLTISYEPFVEDDRIYYQIKDANDKVIRQIVIEKNAGADIIVVDAEGLNPIPLTDFLEEDGLKKK